MGFCQQNNNNNNPLEYPKLGEIWQELKWLFYGGENGFQGNRGNGKLLKRCQPRRAASNSQNIGKYKMGNPSTEF